MKGPKGQNKVKKSLILYSSENRNSLPVSWLLTLAPYAVLAWNPINFKQKNH